MTGMTLFSGPLSMFGAKVHIAALEKNLPVKVVMVPFTMDHSYDLGGDYIAGEYSYADIAFYMAQTFAARLGAPMNRATPRLLAWRERLSTRPAVHQVVLQFADSLARYKLRVPDFIERAAAANPG
jgi:glutathione S-transferase